MNDEAWNTWLLSKESETDVYDYTPRLVIVPVVDGYVDKDSGRFEVTVLGYAGFFIENVGMEGSAAYVEGRFLQFLIGSPGGDAEWIFDPGVTIDQPNNAKEWRLIS